MDLETCPIHNTIDYCPCGDSQPDHRNLRDVVAIAGWQCQRGHRIVGPPTIAAGHSNRNCHWCHGAMSRRGIIFYADGHRVYPTLPADRPSSADLYRYFVRR